MLPQATFPSQQDAHALALYLALYLALGGAPNTFFTAGPADRAFAGLELTEKNVITKVAWTAPSTDDKERKNVCLDVFEGANVPSFLGAVPLYITKQDDCQLSCLTRRIGWQVFLPSATPLLYCVCASLYCVCARDPQPSRTAGRASMRRPTLSCRCFRADAFVPMQHRLPRPKTHFFALLLAYLARMT